MAKSIKFEGKIKIEGSVSAKKLLEVLKYLSEDMDFTVKKYESDEIKLVKKTSTSGQEGNPQMTGTSSEVEIEIEISDNEFEIEVESEDIELVREFTSQIAARF